MVQIVFLGTGQDGGIPHLGCSCMTCEAARTNSEARRLPSCLGIITSSSSFIIDATPHIETQVTSLRKLQNRQDLGIDAIFLTHLHVGHYTGILHLGREIVSTNNFPVYTSAENIEFLKTNKPFSYLAERGEVDYKAITPKTIISLDDEVHISCIEVPHRNEDGNTLGFILHSISTGKKMLYIPDIDYLPEVLLDVIKSIDILVFDGTFYSKNELPRQQNVPHPPMVETSPQFETFPCLRVIYTHFNHTNPVTTQMVKYQDRLGNNSELAFDGFSLTL